MMQVRDFKDFSITSWYKDFKEIAMETIIVELDAQALKVFKCNNNSEVNEDELPHLSETIALKLKAIFELNRYEVFVRNNWHAPTDAKEFSLGNLLRAENLNDIVLFLTVSNIIQDDFARNHTVKPCLALRKWTQIHPATEFRCIVINNLLRAISPRDWPVYYDHYRAEGKDIVNTIAQFFIMNICMKFPRRNFTFDVILQYPDKPILVDFGPLNLNTELYAFKWEEIESLFNKEAPVGVAPVFRYLEKDYGILSRSAAYRQFRRLD